MKLQGLLLSTAVGACAAFVPVAGSAETIRDGFDTSTLLANDDQSTGAVQIGFDVDFFGVVRDALFVNNNGNVTFDTSLSEFTPFDLTATNSLIIAPFFADVDTRSAGVEVTYGQGTVGGRAAFGVNWVNAGFYESQTDPDQLNDIQLVMIERSDTGAGNFDFEFNYGDILWETGDASNGSNGLDGSSARAGYSNGSGNAGTFFEIDGSAVNGAFLNGGSNALMAGSNINEPGRFLFGARSGAIIVPPPVVTPPTSMPTTPSAVPIPASFALLGLGLAGLGAAGARRRRG